ncbi:acyl-CoA dehydrogenase family protein [Allobranchiibius sp. GilTou73]|uniref:acyl-CoA dehydrogenase family protein n=1 Tax=Allobranchiibius sp. GilTou73 TaxID=2904523 RepID=UPI001F32CE17|nr:acyl-CoA dehydrogenase family protein [Allobranchiibius sp. GilTou73]UIJ34954.1 acyl-CoA dehydrogenase family protein [Allobranchiibius sp. GilTou73]
MPASRLLPDAAGDDLIELTRDLCRKELAPRVEAAEKSGELPRDVFRTLGRSGLLGLPYPEELGGGGQPYETYLQVVEEIAATWMSVAVGVSVHALTCFPLVTAGTDEQQATWLTDMLGGDLLGAYCLSERDAGSDIASMRTRAKPVSDGSAYIIRGTKAWISHAGHADYYTSFVRTADTGSRGLSCFLVPADAPGLSAGTPERKMGLASDTVSEIHYEDVHVDTGRRIGADGEGMHLALAALDSGRLGIAAAATGLAQAALDAAVSYAATRTQFGRTIASNQGLQFLLADLQAQTYAARSAYLLAARLKDAGRPFSMEASSAKLIATDAAMRVTTDAIQVLGGAGYTSDFPVERMFRDAKVTQIFEGTNQIQRIVIARHLLAGTTPPKGMPSADH